MNRLPRPPLVVLVIAALILSLAAAFVVTRLLSPSADARLSPGEKVFRAEGIVVTPLRPQPGGLQDGDVVTAIDGALLETWAQSVLDFGAPRPRWRFGQTVIYTVLRAGRRIEVPVTLGRYPIEIVLTREWGAVLFGVFNFLVTAFVFFKRPDLPEARLLFLSGSAMLGATTWSFGAQVGDIVYPWMLWSYLALTVGAYMLVFISVLHFSLLFPRPQGILSQHRWIVPAIYVVPYLVHAAYMPLARMSSATALEWLGQIVSDIGVLELVYLTLALIAGVAAYRAARDPVSRRQFRWIFFGFVVVFIFAAGLAILPAMILGHPLVSWDVVALAGLLVPLAIAVAILRHRLFDIDFIINRTLVYGALTASVAGVYVFVVGYLGTLLHLSGEAHKTADLIISLLATGLVAVLFQPLRDRLQRAVNRLMYGERDDPYAVLSRLSQRLEATLAPEAVLPTIVETVAQALRLPCVAIALREGDEFRIAAAFPPVPSPDSPAGRRGTVEAGRQMQGTLAAEGEVLPLVYQGETVGRLIFAPRAPGEAFTPAERHLLEDIAHQAGVAVHAVRLTADLQHARERLVTAREEERRRLRRDLHDGLGPALAAHTLKVGSARALFKTDPAAADALLAELERDTEAALTDIRRLVYDLRPPALDELGLVGAIRENILQYRTADGLRVAMDAPDAMPPLPAAVEVAAYRIAQEALTNVVRHARAQRCAIILTHDDARPGLILEIRDDGIGLPTERRAGVGLTSMRERAQELGGTCVIESRAEGGTRVFARLPLEQVE